MNDISQLYDLRLAINPLVKSRSGVQISSSAHILRIIYGSNIKKGPNEITGLLHRFYFQA